MWEDRFTNSFSRCQEPDGREEKSLYRLLSDRMVHELQKYQPSSHLSISGSEFLDDSVMPAIIYLFETWIEDRWINDSSSWRERLELDSCFSHVNGSLLLQQRTSAGRSEFQNLPSWFQMVRIEPELCPALEFQIQQRNTSRTQCRGSYYCLPADCNFGNLSRRQTQKEKFAQLPGIQFCQIQDLLYWTGCGKQI